MLTGNNIAKNTAQSILAATTASVLSKGSLFEPPEVYDETIRGYTNYDEKYKSKLNAHEDLTHHSNFQYVRSSVVVLRTNTA